MKTTVRIERPGKNEVLVLDLPFLIPAGQLIRTNTCAAARVTHSALDLAGDEPHQTVVAR